MKELKSMNWHEWIEIEDLTWMAWNEWFDMNCQKCPESTVFDDFLCEIEPFLTSYSKSGLNPSVFLNFYMINYLIIILLPLESKLLPHSRAPFCRPHLGKVVWTCQFLTMFIWNRALELQARAHFVDLIFQKWSGPVSFSKMFLWNWALAIQSCAHFVDHFPRSRREIGKIETL